MLRDTRYRCLDNGLSMDTDCIAQSKVSIWNREKRVKELNSEIRQFNDFVIGDYMDTYNNLTWKTFSGYQYFHEYCQNKNGDTKQKWVLMQDDDTIIDEHRFSSLINDLDNDDLKKTKG